MLQRKIHFKRVLGHHGVKCNPITMRLCWQFLNLMPSDKVNKTRWFESRRKGTTVNDCTERQESFTERGKWRYRSAFAVQTISKRNCRVKLFIYLVDFTLPASEITYSFLLWGKSSKEILFRAKWSYKKKQLGLIYPWFNTLPIAKLLSTLLAKTLLFFFKKMGFLSK